MREADLHPTCTHGHPHAPHTHQHGLRVTVGATAPVHASRRRGQSGSRGFCGLRSRAGPGPLHRWGASDSWQVKAVSSDHVLHSPPDPAAFHALCRNLILRIFKPPFRNEFEKWILFLSSSFVTFHQETLPGVVSLYVGTNTQLSRAKCRLVPPRQRGTRGGCLQGPGDQSFPPGGICPPPPPPTVPIVLFSPPQPSLLSPSSLSPVFWQLGVGSALFPFKNTCPQTARAQGRLCPWHVLCPTFSNFSTNVVTGKL